MVLDAGKVTYATEELAVEEVTVVEEDGVAIRIAPTKPGMIFISWIFIGISEVPTGMLFRETVENMLAVNTSVLRLVLDPETAVHAGDMAMAE